MYKRYYSETPPPSGPPPSFTRPPIWLIVLACLGVLMFVCFIANQDANKPRKSSESASSGSSVISQAQANDLAQSLQVLFDQQHLDYTIQVTAHGQSATMQVSGSFQYISQSEMKDMMTVCLKALIGKFGVSNHKVVLNNGIRDIAVGKYSSWSGISFDFE